MTAKAFFTHRVEVRQTESLLNDCIPTVIEVQIICKGSFLKCLLGRIALTCTYMLGTLQVADSHRVVRMAIFDQFPFTHHIECGVYLQRRKQTH